MRRIGNLFRVLHKHQQLSTRQIILRVAGVALALAMANQVLAQYGGGGMGGGTGSAGSGAGTPNYSPPSYGHGKAIGAGLGAAAGGAALLYLTMRHRGMVTGCVQSANDQLRLVDDKKKQSYTLQLDGADVKAGELVELRGKKTKDGSGEPSFQAQKLVKNLGGC
jgi:hypothetical protein